MASLFVDYKQAIRAFDLKGIAYTNGNAPTNSTMGSGVKVDVSELGCHTPSPGNEKAVTMNPRKEDGVAIINCYSSNCSDERAREAVALIIQSTNITEDSLSCAHCTRRVNPMLRLGGLCKHCYARSVL